MTLTLYQDTRSGPCRSVVLLLETLNVPYVTKMIDLTKLEHKETKYGEIHPLHKVPVLDHDGFMLTESVAILQYLVAVLPDVPDHWYPVDPKTRAKVNEYMMCHHANGLRSNGVFNPYMVRRLDPESDAMKAIMTILEAALDHLNNYFLSKRDFIAGSHISVADLVAYAEVMQNSAVGYPVTRGRQNIEAWLERCDNYFSSLHEKVHAPLIAMTKAMKREW